MSDVIYLAWRYLAYHPVRTTILVASIAIIVYLPISLNMLVTRSASELTARAAATPLLIGANGSPLELVLRSLYFESSIPADVRFGEVERASLDGLATAIPLDVRFRTRHGPLIGTSLDYFAFRGLRFAEGRSFGMLGECVLGSDAARRAQLGVGDTIMSQTPNVFDLAGVPPLKMRIVGVLRATGTPDDRGAFVDTRTSWVIAGLGHGHQDLGQPGLETSILRKEDNEITANASVVQFNEITADNVGSFHFHGDLDDFPITAVIAVPTDARSSTLLQGRYLGSGEPVRVVQPARVMNELLDTILTVRQYVLLAVGLVAAATLATMTLVFALSLQLRRRELETIVKIGGTNVRLVALIGTEIFAVIAAGAVVAILLAVATRGLASWTTEWLVRLV